MCEIIKQRVSAMQATVQFTRSFLMYSLSIFVLCVYCSWICRKTWQVSAKKSAALIFGCPGCRRPANTGAAPLFILFSPPQCFSDRLVEPSNLKYAGIYNDVPVKS